jgi:alpha-N-acetylglucosamine transferase
MNYTFNFKFDDFFGMPSIKIGIDGHVYYDDVVKETVTFDAIVSNGTHKLWIEHYGKLMHHANTEHDRHVFLERLLFNNIDLDQISYCPLTHRGKFYPYYEPSYIESTSQQGMVLPEFIQPNHYFGHNGRWILEYNCPELIWIIQEQNPSGVHLEDTVFSSSHNALDSIKKFFDL